MRNNLEKKTKILSRVKAIGLGIIGLVSAGCLNSFEPNYAPNATLDIFPSLTGKAPYFVLFESNCGDANGPEDIKEVRLRISDENGEVISRTSRTPFSYFHNFENTGVYGAVEECEDYAGSVGRDEKIVVVY
ncbi:MAG: hypothetical protein ABIH49_01570 [archaeon]